MFVFKNKLIFYLVALFDVVRYHLVTRLRDNFRKEILSPPIRPAKVQGGSENMFAMTSSIARPSVCLSSVTFVRPTQAVQIIGNISAALGTLAIH